MKKPLCISGIVLGGLLTAAPLVCLPLSMLSMMSTFNRLGHPGISDPEQVASGVRSTLLLVGGGILILPLGLALLIVSIVFLVRRPQSISPLQR